MDIDEIIQRIEKKLEANWYVDEQEIRALINYIREHKPKK